VETTCAAGVAEQTCIALSDQTKRRKVHSLANLFCLGQIFVELAVVCLGASRIDYGRPTD
jgi:hypothetical protein